jgi:hypothetical protein
MNADGSGQQNLSRHPAEDDCCLAGRPGRNRKRAVTVTALAFKSAPARARTASGIAMHAQAASSLTMLGRAGS